MKETKTAIAYFRVSTDMQKEDLSLETQERGGEIFAKDNNIRIIKKYTDVMSGGNRQRKGFIAAQKYLEDHKGEIDYFIAYDVSRIARDAFAFLSLFNKLNILGVKLKLINNPTLNSDSPMGKLILTILAAIFEFFRFDSADRTRDNMIVRVKEGKRMNNPPFGYRMENKRMVVVPEEAELVKYVFEQYLQGNGIVALEGMTGKHRSTIKQWLNNKVYVGINVFGKKKMNKSTFKQEKNNDIESIIEAPGDWEPIIARELWDKVEERIQLNQEFRIRNFQRTAYLLSGLLFHAECGNKFRGNAGRKGTNYYRCIGCNRSIKTTILDKIVLDELFSSGVLDTLNKQISSTTNNEKKELIQLQKRKNNLKIKDKKLVDLYLENLIDKADYIAKKEALKVELAEIDKSINAAAGRDFTKKQNINFVKMFQKALANLQTTQSTKDANRILKLIIKKIEVNDKKEVVIHLNI